MARVGENDAAAEHIRYLLSIPSLLSPDFVTHRSVTRPSAEDPRFWKLVELACE